MPEQPPFIRRRCPSCKRIISDAWIERQRKKTGKHPTKHSCGERLRDPAGCLHFGSQTEQLDSVYGRCMECGLLLKRGEDTRFYFEFEEEKVDDEDRK